MTDAELLNRFLFALCIWREARGESLTGKQMVADVIRNRVTDPRWPNSYAEVVLQPKQFSCFNAGDPNVVKFPSVESPAWGDCLAVVDAVLAGAPATTTANHYCTLNILPAWADATKMVGEEGNHRFYRL